MLPPFVPPSVRVPTQPLPLITEFVVDRGERVISSSVATAPWESQTQWPEHEPAPEPTHEPMLKQAPEPAPELALPSIDEFLLLPAVESAASPTEAPLSAAPSEEAPVAEPVALVQDYTAETPHAEPEQPAPVLEQPSSESVQQEAQPTVTAEPEAPAAEEVHAPTETAPAEEEAPSNPSVMVQPASQTAHDGWVSEERDSFDWQGAANLAAGADEERRASEEWSSTEWEPRGSGSQEQPEHIVALLAQVARRVRSGELQVHGSKQMTVGAALAAVLAALLAETE